MTAEEAAAVFEGIGIGFTETNEFSDTVVAGYVIRQEPPAGEKMSPDTVSNLYISLGPSIKTAVVPNIVGMTEAEAIIALQSKGIAVGLSTKAPSSTVPVGCIISQTIKDGIEIVQGVEVSYVISTGPAQSKPTATIAPPSNLRTKTLKIEFPLTSEEITSIHLRVNKIIAGGAENILDEVVPAEDFPYSVKLSGTGVVEYQVYVVRDDGGSQIIAEQYINFNE
jgi:serine/threonine-protein kinase